MKKDAEVLRYMRERRKGTNQELAAARAGMSVKTARKYERGGLLPSQLKQPRTWRTRPNPFEEDWAWVIQQLQRDSALQGATLFAELCQHNPGKYRPTQVRTLQRHIAQWRAQQGPEREVIFEQVHVPAERAQSDFTHMNDLQVTINGQAFPHLLYHFVLTYSNVEALRVRGSREFSSRAAYERFVQDLVRNRNLTRANRLQQEQAALRPLPRLPLAPCREFRVSVSRFSTISVLGKRYSVPSRLIGTTVLARLRAETVEVYVGTRQILTLPRIQGAATHAVNYHHVIWSLVRKPGAFAHYRYREDLFPTLAFRQAYDAVCKHQPQHADRHYVRGLHLAATTSEGEVETAIGLLLEHSQVPTFDAVRDLVRVPQIPALGQMNVNLQAYDQLLSSQQRRSHA